jgi:hypothetical protein
MSTTSLVNVSCSPTTSLVFVSCRPNTSCYCSTTLRESDISWRQPFVCPIHICPTLLTLFYPALKLIDQTIHDVCWNLTATKHYRCAYSLDSIVHNACKKPKCSPSALLTYHWSSLQPLFIPLWPVGCSDIFSFLLSPNQRQVNVVCDAYRVVLMNHSLPTV